MSREMIAKILKRLRKQSGLSADQVGKMIGKSGKTVNAWENNHGQPDADTLVKLCRIYNVDDILAEFRGDANTDNIELSEKEKNVILAYRAHPEMQPAVDTLLKIQASGSISSDIGDTVENGEKAFAPIHIELK